MIPRLCCLTDVTVRVRCIWLSVLIDSSISYVNQNLSSEELWCSLLRKDKEVLKRNICVNIRFLLRRSSVSCTLDYCVCHIIRIIVSSWVPMTMWMLCRPKWATEREESCLTFVVNTSHFRYKKKYHYFDMRIINIYFWVSNEFQQNKACGFLTIQVYNKLCIRRI